MRNRVYSSLPERNKGSIHNVFIKEAYSLINKNKFSESILLLEKVIEEKINKPYPYFLLAISYLLTSQFNKVDLMLKRLRSLEPDYIPLVNLELFLFLKSSPNKETIIAKYLEALNRFPYEKRIQRNLEFLRNVNDFPKFQKEALLQNFILIPNPEKEGFIVKINANKNSHINSLKINKITILVFILLIVISLSVLFFIGTDRFMDLLKDNKRTINSHDKIDQVTLSPARYELFEKYNKKKNPEFYMSNEEVTGDFNKAKYLIKSEHYNEALIYLNRLYNSNVNVMVKNRVEFLIKFIRDVDFRKFELIDFNKINKKLYLYKGIAVQWKGRVANLRKKKDKLFFNLLIDYKDKDVFAGIAEVYAGMGAENIENGDNILVKGIFLNTIGSEKRVYLEASEIKKYN